MSAHPADVISNNIANRSTAEINQARRNLSDFMDELTANPEDDDVLTGIKVVLDRFMFGNTLRNVRIRSHKFEDPNDGGQTIWWVNTDGSPFAIFILISPEPPMNDNHSTRIVQNLSDIAHECIHAFLNVNKLANPDYVPRKEEMERNNAEVIEGGNSHGPTWERCAYVVKEAIERDFGYTLDLEIAASGESHRKAVRENAQD